MKGIVTIYFWICPTSPSFISYWHCLLRRWNGKVNERSCSSSNRCLASCIKIVDSICSHKRQLHVCVSINTTRNQKFVSTVNDLCIFVCYIFADLGDFSLWNEYVALFWEISVNDSGIFKEIALSELDSVDERFVKDFSHFSFKDIFDRLQIKYIFM